MVESAAELKELRLARGHLKSALTRFSTFVEGFVDDKVVQLAERLQKIEPSFEEFGKLQTKIELLDNNESESNELINFEQSYFDIIEKAKIHINRVNAKIKAENSKTEANILQTAMQSTQQQSNVKYPTLELPKFFGDYDKWGQFRDMFSALVHKNNQMENIKKFYYLVSCLKGEAAKIIDSMEITNDNYPTAWELLVARYENKQITIKNHVRALFELPSIGKESHTALRRLTDEVEKHIRSLKILKEPVDSWDTLLIHLVVSKLDISSAKSWEEYSIAKKLESQKYADLTSFLGERCQLLEALDRKTGIFNKLPDNLSKPFYKNKASEKIVSNVVQNAYNSCSFCKQAHPIYFCEKLKALPIASRLSEVKRLRLCTNCLRNNHSTMECNSQGCKKCSKKHNTLLHIESYNPSASVSKVVKVEQPIDSQDNIAASAAESSLSTGLLAGHCSNPEPQILLSTAIILIRNKLGNWQRCRALIDNGSMPNFITRDLCSKLNLTTVHTNTPVVGVGKSSTNIAKRTRAVIKSVHSDFTAELSFFVIGNITERLPLTSFDSSKVKIPNRIVLADPDFNISQQIDVLLGAGVFCDLLNAGIVKLGDGLPVLQNTVLGWIVSGPIITYRQTSSSSRTICSLAIDENIYNTNTIESQLENFWIIEECQQRKNISLEEQQCEQNFIKTLQRDDSNHFVVSLPIRENAGFIGESLSNAVKRLQSMELKFRKNIAFKQQYKEFITEYENLGHMTKINDPEINEPKSTFYLPHHGVINEASTTTKLRVVFDGSCKSTSGVSLNDILKVGPTLQDDLFSILIRFRKHNFVVTADIEKMYRQVYIAENQRDLQRIVWRQNESDEIQHYKLNTVTYGTSSAAYLAIRSLQQVAIEKVDQFPDISEVILHDFYVDDLLTGCDTIDNAITIKSDLTKILSEYGFHLRKWVANDSRITGDSQSCDYPITDNETTKRTLGLIWQSKSDILKYSTIQLNSCKNATKRTVLSAIATLFDPLGLVAPVTVRAKLIMQKLWEKKLDWDSPLPTEIYNLWVNYNKQLCYVNQIEQPRHAIIKDPVYIELHGFCDSSQGAYGGCFYLLSRDIAGNVFARLLCAKSRVAPLKVQTLPRLELCGAMLLTNLYKKVVEAIKINIDKVSFWTDSTIVLAWISAEPSKWKTFVANRVSEIQSTTKIEQWGHVVSKENPADLISRGVDPRDLIHNTLWWNGPTWLALAHNHRPNINILQQTDSENIPEKRKVKPCCFNVTSDFNIFNRYSTLYRLLRVISLCMRFSHNVGKPDQRKTGELTIEEINNTLIILLKISQTESFFHEIKDIKASKQISNKSKLLSLNPFIDNQGLLRVGGRLSKSNIPYDKKYPIILSPKHPLTRMIILDEHHRQLHSGAQTLLASLRERYWPLTGRATVRSVLRKCLTCFRVNPTAAIRKMGDLPLERVSMNRPFAITGVDFAGPFSIKDGKLRNRSIVKSYLCIFICFSTKAVHLEAVSDLGKTAFLNALKRFVSRRGLSKIIYSDNGTNFVGANNEMKQIVQSLSEFVTEREYSEFFIKNNIEWRFTPPYSPHHGGLWEAAVKRAKYHITRVIGIGSNKLTFEEIGTIFAQVEAIMNSRPLTPLSADPNDFTVLTPGHFLIGSSLSSLPQRNVTHFPENRLKQYERVQQSVQHFWTRWSREYLSQVQERTKWKQNQKDAMEIGSMVVLINEGSPPLSWKLGRIVELHPGNDGIVRVVTVKTETGLTKRAVQKLCLLPLEQ